MEIERALEYNEIVSHAKEALLDSSLECELQFKPQTPVTREGFSRVLAHLNSSSGFRNVTGDDDVLDVRVEGQHTRVHICGQEAIVHYCRTDRVMKNNASADIKHNIPGKHAVDVSEYQYKIRLRRDEKITSDAQFEDAVRYVEDRKTPKHYRFKKTFSYVSNSGTLRADLSVVKTCKANTSRFAHSGTLMAPEEFEIELEVLANAKAKAEEVVNEMLVTAGQFTCLLENWEYLMSSSTVFQVQQNLIKLSFPGTDKHTTTYNKLVRNPREYFIGPKSVTLEMQNVAEPDVDNVSIQKGYTVTDKADGERAFLYIDTDRRVYLVNDRMKVSFTGLLHERVNTILDGEFITQHGRKLFLVFDVYFVDGNPVHQLPLLQDGGESRLGHAADVLRTSFRPVSPERGPMLVRLKQFMAAEGSGIFAAAKTFLDDHRLHKYEYHIDGLIFTPVADPVLLGKTWPKVFKWKPPKDNTIDFLVEFKDDLMVNIGGANKLHKLVHLSVGHRPEEDTMDIIQVLTSTPATALAQKGKVVTYSKKVFTTAYLPVEDDGYVYSEEGEQVSNNTIVECSYNMDQDIPESARWVVKRIRHDKTMLLKSTGKISGTANDIKIAQSTWRTIQNPITEDIITGKQLVAKEDVVKIEDAYYNREVSRTETPLKPMLDFHNWIKSDCLIKPLGRSKRNAKLFDMGCGKGGDLMKWVLGGYSQVIGIDVSQNNIMDPKDGAYKRFQQLRERGKIRPEQKMVFMIMDAGKQWTNDYILGLSPESNRYLAQIVMGVGMNRERIQERALKPLFEAGKEQSDVVSCQFAIHYFFKNESTLDTFLNNVDRVLKPGGYFMGTCMDGFLVDRMLNDKALGESVEGAQEGRVLWRVTKAYDEFDTANPRNNFGKKIQNYIETINQVIDEYLVDFNLLTEKLQERHISLIPHGDAAKLNLKRGSGSFKELFNDMLDLQGSAPERYGFLKNATEMSPLLKQYSFMNRWFIFRKDDASVHA
jgi:SAM-dependent methyltransferase